MNYLIYCGIFILGALCGIVIMVLLVVANEGASIEGKLREICEQKKMDDLCLSKNKQRLSGFPLKKVSISAMKKWG